METLLVATVLAAYIAVLTLATTRERREWAAERRDLLNRIMAKTYNEFAYTKTIAVEVPQMTTDEAEAKWAVEHESADAAWHAENRRQHPELYPDDVVLA